MRCQLGEREAFGELVDVWHAPLRRYLRGVAGGSPDTADDLAQETWVAVLRGLPGLRHPERFAPWLFTVARRALTNHLRQAYRAPETSPRAAEPQPLPVRTRSRSPDRSPSAWPGRPSRSGR
ncbi:RNA polymerase sigma factor [Kitasatospora purpeofusca]|uniref:RNA polymerase sigma factor n=1 Tax=Kitasatospora purpeofusca TaxID=67352 RepID=UPI0038215D74